MAAASRSWCREHTAGSWETCPRQRPQPRAHAQEEGCTEASRPRGSVCKVPETKWNQQEEGTRAVGWARAVSLKRAGGGGEHRWVVSRSGALPLRGSIGGARALKERPVGRQLRPGGEKTGAQRPLGREGWCKGDRRSGNRLGRNWGSLNNKEGVKRIRPGKIWRLAKLWGKNPTHSSSNYAQV